MKNYDNMDNLNSIIFNNVYISHILSIDPLRDKSLAFYNEGCMHVKNNNFIKAETSFLNSISIDDNFDKAWHNLALTYYQLGKLDDAKTALIKTNKLDSNNLNVLNQLANIYTILEQYQDAVKIYNQLIELDPEDHLSWSNKGANLMKSQYLQDAHECFIKSLEINPNNFDAYYNLACLFAKSNEPEKVIINLKNAQSINPSFKIKDSLLNDPDLQSINQHKIIKDYISFSQ